MCYSAARYSLAVAADIWIPRGARMWLFGKPGRIGVPILASREYQSNLVFFGPTGIGTLPLIRRLHDSASPEATDLPSSRSKDDARH